MSGVQSCLGQPRARQARRGGAVLTLTLTFIMETSFRKIDIDVYDEDVLQEEELYDADPRDPAQVLSDAKQKASAVRGYLSKCVTRFVVHFVNQLKLQGRCSRRSDSGAN